MSIANETIPMSSRPCPAPIASAMFNSLYEIGWHLRRAGVELPKDMRERAGDAFDRYSAHVVESMVADFEEAR